MVKHVKEVVFSGIQPTGNLHIGNYFSVIKNFLNLQKETNLERFFCIVDMHSITVPYVPERLRENIIKITALYLACGLDASKTNIFLQSDVYTHTILAWIINCFTSTKKLSQMNQFKNKDNKIVSSVGLYTYPCLMAADILLYKTKYVPIGKDQTQHLEITRKIAKNLNTFLDKSLFTVPKEILNKKGSKIMSLKDASVKMSKSSKSDYERINLLDTEEQILFKIKKAKTDSKMFPRTLDDFEERKEIQNLATIYSLCTEYSTEKLVAQFGGKPLVEFKNNLGEALEKIIKPIRKEYDKIITNKKCLEGILKKGKKIALEKTVPFIEEIRKEFGIALNF